ncbi:MAG TPA: rhomboid family intramembrane serine protease [Candidatus Thermoplasmatota archaeon]|nr:rhomboid family intramembrane serine protease [Candidatus Thermoplasmatota archaeon]
MAVHERVWDRSAAAPPSARPARPLATYTLLAAMAGVYVLEFVLSGFHGTIPYHGVRFDLAYWTFIIDTDWVWRPWTLVTSTMAHSLSGLTHLLFNGLFLFFFGPLVERILGSRRFAVLFFAAGAVSGVVQVHLADAFGNGGGALGASGALMALFGVVMVLLPRERIYVYGVVPVPMWLAGIGYAALDLVGAFNPYSGIGNFAHLCGMAIGLAYGAWMRQDMRGRGLRLVRG